jgi:GntR family transcriptional regulator
MTTVDVIGPSSQGETAPLVRLDSTDLAPLYVQIERGIRAAVATGRLAKGAQLPTVRQLAVALRVNANTVAKVYSDLERNGFVETRRGVGTFVAEAAVHPHQNIGHQALRDFAARVLEEAAARGFPREEFIAQLQIQLKEEHRG